MKISVILTLIFCISTFVYAYQADVENISNRDYFQPVLNAINNAKESIVMGMYIISMPKDSDGGRPSAILRR